MRRLLQAQIGPQDGTPMKRSFHSTGHTYLCLPDRAASLCHFSLTRSAFDLSIDKEAEFCKHISVSDLA
jgi:hypothetical protein